MINEEFTVIDDVFPDIDEIVEWSRQRPYYRTDRQKNSKAIPGVRIASDPENRPGGAWRGYRARLDDDKNRSGGTIVQYAVTKALLKTQKVSTSVDIAPYFNIQDQHIPFEDSWWHTDDSCMYTGIVYLNKEHPEGQEGTVIQTSDGKRHGIPFKHNRMLLYNGYLWHRPGMGWGGDSFENSRRTLTFCVYRMQMCSIGAYHKEYMNRHCVRVNKQVHDETVTYINQKYLHDRKNQSIT